MRHSTIENCVDLEKAVPMPKLKSRKAAAKRLRATGSGKIVHRRTFRSHLLEHKSPARKRRLAGMAVVSERDDANIRLMLPYL